MCVCVCARARELHSHKGVKLSDALSTTVEKALKYTNTHTHAHTHTALSTPVLTKHSIVSVLPKLEIYQSTLQNRGHTMKVNILQWISTSDKTPMGSAVSDYQMYNTRIDDHKLAQRQIQKYHALFYLVYC